MFQRYLAHFKAHHLSPEQRGSNPKSFAEARLRRIAGSRIAAFIVFEIGVPRLTVCLYATEQPAARNKRLHHDASIIMMWLSVVARAVHDHKHMSHYETAHRRAGDRHRVSPLTPDEVVERAALHRAQQRLRQGRWLSRQINATQLLTPEQRALAADYDSGNLEYQANRIRERRQGLALRLGRLVQVRP